MCSERRRRVSLLTTPVPRRFSVVLLFLFCRRPAARACGFACAFLGFGFAAHKNFKIIRIGRLKTGTAVKTRNYIVFSDGLNDGSGKMAATEDAVAPCTCGSARVGRDAVDPAGGQPAESGGLHPLRIKIECRRTEYFALRQAFRQIRRQQGVADTARRKRKPFGTPVRRGGFRRRRFRR